MHYGSAAAQAAAPCGIFFYPFPLKGSCDDGDHRDVDVAVGFWGALVAGSI